jgi:hypothetical protein
MQVQKGVEIPVSTIVTYYWCYKELYSDTVSTYLYCKTIVNIQHGNLIFYSTDKNKLMTGAYFSKNTTKLSFSMKQRRSSAPDDTCSFCCILSQERF